MGDGSNSINYHRVGVIRENPMRCIYTADDQGEIFISMIRSLYGLCMRH